MHGHPQKTKLTSPELKLDSDKTALIRNIGLGVGAVSLILAVVLSLTAFDLKRFLFAYLVGYSFFITITVGSLFWVTIMHLTKAGWGIVVRRLAEILSNMMFPMLVLFLPILITVLSGNSDLYQWNSSEWMEAEGQKFKSVFLNAPWFAVRCLIYFGIWGFMARFFYTRSLTQDVNGDKKLTVSMETFSAPGMVLFALTIVFASFDFQMSTSAKWFSTMYPVYFFATSALSSLVTLIFLIFILQKSGIVTEDISIEHYHDLGKLTFGFIVFWGYIAFSQFMLIWYANIPEETFWFGMRNKNGWMEVSMLLLVGHLFVPFLALMARTVRRNKAFLFGASIFILVMHFVDHFWLIMPNFSSEFVAFGPVEILCFGSMCGFYVAGVCWLAADKPLIPLGDPRLVESLNFKNL